METFAKSIHVLVDNTLRPGADASQADAQLALARNQLIQAQTQEAVRRFELSKYLPIGSDRAPEIDASQLLATLPPSDPNPVVALSHPAVLEEVALVGEQEATEARP